MSRDALVVGINTYSYARLRNLTAPAQDAEAIAKLLEDYGEFNVKRLPAVKDKQNNTIRVGQKTGVTLTQLREAIVQLFKPEGRNIPDTALLYFSGHGLRRNQGIQEGFLATSDVNPDLEKWGLSLQWLRQLLQESEVKQQIIWLDCCYSGELLKFEEANPGDKGKGRDRCFIAASREFEPAFEAIATNHSVLTTALLKGLKPTEHQQRVTNYTLISAIQENLPNFPQRPIFANSGGVIHLTRSQEAIPKVGEVSENKVKDESEQQQLQSNSVMGQPTHFPSNVSSPKKQFQNLVQLWRMKTIQVRRFVLLSIMASILVIVIVKVIIPWITLLTLIKDVDVPEGQFNYTGTTSWSSVRCADNATGIDREVYFHSKGQLFQPHYKLPKDINPTAKGPSSLEGIKLLINSEDIAFVVSSRPLDNEQKQAAQARGLTLEEYPVAGDITTIAVNYNLNLTKIGGLPLKDLKTIYTSDQQKFWGDLTGSAISPDIKIVPFIHEAETKKVYAFQKNVLKGQDFSSIVQSVPNTATGINNVKNTPGGIYLAPAALIYTYYHQKQPSVQPMPIIGDQGKPVLPFEKSFNPQDICDQNKQKNSPVQVNPEYSKELQHEIVYVIVKRHNTNATEVQKKQEKAGLAYAQILKTGEGRNLLARMGFQPL